MIAYIICALIGAAIAIAAYTVIQRIVLNGRKTKSLPQAEVEPRTSTTKRSISKEKFPPAKSEHDKYVNDKKASLNARTDPPERAELNQQNNECRRRSRKRKRKTVIPSPSRRISQEGG